MTKITFFKQIAPIYPTLFSEEIEANIEAFTCVNDGTIKKSKNYFRLIFF